MKFVAVLIVFLLAAMTISGTATAKPYVSANAGALWTSDSDLSIDGYNEKGEHSYDMGYMIDVAIGNAFSNGFRAELEIPYRFNDVDEYSPPQLTGMEFDREISSLALMVNGYYDFDTGTAWKPFVGAGIGYALMQVEGWTTHHDDGVFAYQAMAGCGYSLNQKFTIDLQYRFYATEDPEFNTRDPDTGRTTIETEYMTQSLMLGLRYSY